MKKAAPTALVNNKITTLLAMPRHITLLFDVKLQRCINLLPVVNRFKHMDTPLTVGGGVTKTTIGTLEKLGVNKFLVGTAIHNGDF